ncbi:hypothetical protein PTTG_01317 [Puccinia triticina 1-1 BBBD Race 1]|uniref:Uncharacterized protein n=1 Tax=Puccinia triticina (isolate 1-1 / race 1 (BBBD)) TaxID=630390 RepID=A0A180FZX8_PUCT1|nr:hypothetical protein PTTG_01317 [Puccinia triticina 1-1 BBBD Race 1]
MDLFQKSKRMGTLLQWKPVLMAGKGGGGGGGGPTSRGETIEGNCGKKRLWRNIAINSLGVSKASSSSSWVIRLSLTIIQHLRALPEIKAQYWVERRTVEIKKQLDRLRLLLKAKTPAEIEYFVSQAEKEI